MDRNRPGEILGGIFLILFGLCLVLAGGACSAIWSGLLLEDAGPSLGAEIALLLMSVFTAGLGVLCILRAVRMLSGRAREG